MQKKFVKLYETIISRFTNGGFFVGDYVKFVKDHDKHEQYLSLGSNVKEMISKIIDSGLHVRIVGIKDIYPLSRPGNPDTRNGNNLCIDIALDNGGGRMTDYVTVPRCCIELIDSDGINLPKLPDKFNFREIDTDIEEYKDIETTTKPKGFNYELGK
jgi:hypothetical protein